MAKITATITELFGVKMSVRVTVEGTPEHVDAIKCDDMLVKELIMQGIESPKPVLGTYLPEPGSMLSAYYVIWEYADIDKINTYGNIGKAPEYDPDVIY